MSIPIRAGVAFLVRFGMLVLLAIPLTMCMAGDVPRPLPSEGRQFSGTQCQIWGTLKDGILEGDTNCPNFSYGVINGYLYIGDHQWTHLIPISKGDYTFGWIWNDDMMWFRSMDDLGNYFWVEVDITKRREI